MLVLTVLCYSSPDKKKKTKELNFGYFALKGQNILTTRIVLSFKNLLI